MDVLAEYTSVHHMHAVPKEARRGNQIRVTNVRHIQLGIELVPLEDQSVLLSTEPAFQPTNNFSVM